MGLLCTPRHILLLITLIVSYVSAMVYSGGEVIACPGGTMVYAISIGVPTNVVWQGDSNLDSTLSKFSPESSYSVCIMCARIMRLQQTIKRTSRNIPAEQISNDPDSNRLSYQICLNQGYSAERTFSQLFKCGVPEDFLQDFRKNSSGLMTSFDCMAAGNPSHPVNNYESRFPSSQTNSRAQSNWKDLDIDLECSGRGGESTNTRFLCGLKVHQGQTTTSNGSSEVEHGNLEAICCFAKEVFGKSPEEFIDINCTEAKRYHAYSVAGLSLGVIILVIVIAIIIINYCCCKICPCKGKRSNSSKVSKISPRYLAREGSALDRKAESGQGFNSRPATSMEQQPGIRKHSVVHNGGNSGFRIVESGSSRGSTAVTMDSSASTLVKVEVGAARKPSK